MKLPTLFLSHGSPMMALETPQTDEYVAKLHELWSKLPVPKAILAISAHWYVRGKYVDVSADLETIHDFGGFPDELYQQEYPAPGYPEGADLLRELLPDVAFQPVERWLDHGAWTTLMHLYPRAHIPVFSISLDVGDNPEEHFELGKRLRILRDHGILVIGMGNLVHNLMLIDFSAGQDTNTVLDFWMQFDSAFKRGAQSGNYASLLDPWKMPGWKLSAPTPEHYLPAVVILWTAYEQEPIEWIYEWFELGTIGRRAFGFGVGPTN